MLWCIKSCRGKGSSGTVICICGNGWERCKSEDVVINAIQTGHEMIEYSFKTIHRITKHGYFLARVYFKHCVNLAPKLRVKYPTQLHIWLKMPAVIPAKSDSLFKYLFFTYQQIFSSGGNGGTAVLGPPDPSKMNTT